MLSYLWASPFLFFHFFFQFKFSFVCVKERESEMQENDMEEPDLKRRNSPQLCQQASFGKRFKRKSFIFNLQIFFFRSRIWHHDSLMYVFKSLLIFFKPKLLGFLFFYFILFIIYLLYCEIHPFKLEWFLCQEEEDEGLESCPLMFILNNLEGKKQESF